MPVASMSRLFAHDAHTGDGSPSPLGRIDPGPLGKMGPAEDLDFEIHAGGEPGGEKHSGARESWAACRIRTARRSQLAGMPQHPRVIASSQVCGEVSRLAQRRPRTRPLGLDASPHTWHPRTTSGFPSEGFATWR